MKTKEDLDNSIIYRKGTICYTENYSFDTRKYVKGFRLLIEFEDLDYLDFDKYKQKAEFSLDLFILHNINTSIELASKIIGNKIIYQQVIGKKFALPINPEPEFNENSIYMNSGHTPIEVTFIEILGIESRKLKIRFDLQIFGKTEDTLPFNLFTEKEILIDIIYPEEQFK